MKCTECENWDAENQSCTETDSDPGMAPDKDILRYNGRPNEYINEE